MAETLAMLVVLVLRKVTAVLVLPTPRWLAEPTLLAEAEVVQALVPEVDLQAEPGPQEMAAVVIQARAATAAVVVAPPQTVSIYLDTVIRGRA